MPKQELVKDWMEKDVVTISPLTSLTEAHRIMADKNIRRLPIIENKKLVGIVTRGDVRGAEPSEATSLSIWELNYILSRLRIKDIMTRNPITVHPDTTIEECAKIMMEKKISGLPVVDEENCICCGIITESDIFRLVVQTWHQE
jgi:CBS domain-containing protein